MSDNDDDKFLPGLEYFDSYCRNCEVGRGRGLSLRGDDRIAQHVARKRPCALCGCKRVVLLWPRRVAQSERVRGHTTENLYVIEEEDDDESDTKEGAPMTNYDEKQPNPGSPAAVKKGCLCPTDHNHNGAGVLGDSETYGFKLHDDCLLHVPDVL